MANYATEWYFVNLSQSNGKVMEIVDFSMKFQLYSRPAGKGSCLFRQSGFYKAQKETKQEGII